MVRLLVVVLLSLAPFFVKAEDQYVRGYYRKNGTYVQPYMRTKSNDTVFDNYSTKGNVNPYTGQQGTKDPYKLNNYGSGNNNGYNWNY